MEISLFLARVIGITMAILYAGAIINFKRLQTSLRQIEEQPVILFISGFMALVLGVLILQVHNFWVWDWTIIITLIGWLMVIIGSIRILIPNVAIAMGRSLLERNPNIAYAVTFMFCAIGVFLTIMGCLPE